MYKNVSIAKEKSGKNTNIFLIFRAILFGPIVCIIGEELDNIIYNFYLSVTYPNECILVTKNHIWLWLIISIVIEMILILTIIKVEKSNNKKVILYSLISFIISLIITGNLYMTSYDTMGDITGGCSVSSSMCECKDNSPYCECTITKTSGETCKSYCQKKYITN